MPDEDTARLELLRDIVVIGPGEAVFQEGDPASHVYSVISGCVRTYKMLPDGRRQITGFVLPGNLIGLTFEDCYDHHAEAVGETRVCRIACRDMQALAKSYPFLERRFVLFLGQRLALAQKLMLMLGRKTPLEKLASLLCCMSITSSPDGAPVNPVQLPMSRADIADYLGLTIETVSRSFSRLRAEGVIALPGPDVVDVRDRKRLEAMAAL